MLKHKITAIAVSGLMAATMLAGALPVSAFAKEATVTTVTETKEASTKKKEETSEVKKGAEVKESEIKMIPYQSGKEISNGEFSVTLPKGFSVEKSANGGVYAVSKSKAANITYTVGTKPEAVSSAKEFAKELASSYPKDANVTVKSASSLEMNKRKGCQVVLEVEQGARTYTQMVFVIPGAEGEHVLVYTEDKDSGYENAFKSSAGTAMVVQQTKEAKANQ